MQLLQLRHGLVGAVDDGGARARWWRRGHLPLEEAEVLEESYRFCEGTRNRTFLVVGQRRRAAQPARAGHPRRPLARASRCSELRERYRRVTRRARRVVERRFYGQG